MNDIFLGLPTKGITNFIERKHCFWFEIEEDGATISLVRSSAVFSLNLEISLDGKKTWNPYDGYIIGEEIPLKADDRIYMRATDEGNQTIGSSSSSYYRFILGNKKVGCHGNIQCLLDKYGRRNDVHAYCYLNMFLGCSSLTAAPELSATTLADNCYNSMFYGCTSLTTAPALPAKLLTKSCYDSMFSDCTSLTSAPNLPATTLADNCYTYMFNDCTKLANVDVNHIVWNPPTATINWLTNAGSSISGKKTFSCPQDLIDATTTRSNSTVPSTWTMVAK